MQLEEERGNGDEQGRLPSAKPEGNSLDYGTENQTKLVGQPVRGKIYEFAPAIDEFLKAHLFGDVFARDIGSRPMAGLEQRALITKRRAREQAE